MLQCNIVSHWPANTQNDPSIVQHAKRSLYINVMNFITESSTVSKLAEIFKQSTHCLTLSVLNYFSEMTTIHCIMSYFFSFNTTQVAEIHHCSLIGSSLAQAMTCCLFSTMLWPGSAFIKPDQRNPWIKDQIKITLLPTISHCRCKIVDSRSFHIWSLIHGLRWSGLIKVGPEPLVIYC